MFYTLFLKVRNLNNTSCNFYKKPKGIDSPANRNRMGYQVKKTLKLNVKRKYMAFGHIGLESVTNCLLFKCVYGYLCCV